MSDLISVVMPMYRIENHSVDFHAAMEGIAKQSYINWELIMVCDGREENTIRFSKKYTKHYKKQGCDIKVYISPRAKIGPGLIRNAAFPHTKGKYLTFHDSDDYSVPNRFKKLVGAIGNNHIAYSNVYVQDSAARSRGKSYPGATLRNLIVEKKPKPPFHLSSALISRKLFEKLGGFDGENSYSSDADFAMRAGYYREMMCLPEIPCVKQNLFIWKRRGNSITGSDGKNSHLKVSREKMRNRIKRDFYTKLIELEVCVGDPEEDILNALNMCEGIKNPKTLQRIL